MPVNNLAFKKQLPFIIPTALFFLLSFVGILHHEMWRDEYQARLITLNSHSLSEIFHNIRYEGHPVLWFLLLYVLKFISTSEFAMQILHIIIATASVLIIFRYSPFSLLQKSLMVCGYFLLYEYNIISRNYALGVLLFFSFVALYPNWRKRIILTAITIALLANTNVYAFIIACTCCLLLLLDAWYKKDYKINLQWFTAGIIVLGGLIISALVMKPAPDAAGDIGLDLSLSSSRISDSLRSVFIAFFPIPNLISKHSWNTNFAGNSAGPQVIISLIIFFTTAYHFRKNTRHLIFYTTGMLILLFFSYVTGLSFLRHVGHFYIFWLGCTWLYFKETTKPAVALQAMLYLILAVQSTAAFALFYNDYKKPFSESESATKFLKDDKLDSLIITGMPDYIVTPFSSKLNKPVYYLESDSWGTFIKWDSTRHNGSLENVQLANLVKLSKNHKQDIIAVLNQEITATVNGEQKILQEFYLDQGIKMKKIAEFKRSIVDDEIYFLYKVMNEK